MKLIKDGKLKWEKGEPRMRSCWKCNSAHNILKKVNMLHVCFECGKHWIYGKFIEELFNDKDNEKECEEKLYNWLKKQGLEDGDSTSKIDKGYRLYQVTITSKGAKA